MTALPSCVGLSTAGRSAPERSPTPLTPRTLIFACHSGAQRRIPASSTWRQNSHRAKPKAGCPMHAVFSSCVGLSTAGRSAPDQSPTTLTPSSSLLVVILERSEESPHLLRGGTKSPRAMPKAGCPMHDSLFVMRGSIDRRSIRSGTEPRCSQPFYPLSIPIETT